MTLSKSFFMLVLAFVSMCVAGGAAVAALSGTGSGGATVVAVVALGIAAGILWFEAKSDLDAVLTLVSVFLILTAVCVGIYLLYGDRPGIAPKIALGASLLIGVPCGVLTYRRQHGNSTDFPNVLLTKAAEKSLWEKEGVQFTGIMTQGSGGKPHTISVLLQNCFNAPRTIRIRFEAAGSEKYMRFHPEHQVRLGPAEVARVVFPVVAPTYPGSYFLYFSIAVGGRDGKRVRLWRAQEATERTRQATTAALLAVGALWVGGGLRFTVGPLPDDIWAAPLAPPTPEILWRPRPGTVPLAQTAA
jgi:hypothetical protein